MTINNRIGVVVLNYVKFEETIRCVESLLKQVDVDLNVVIVDNGSGNDSVDKIRQKFSDISFIKIVELPKNFGYAQGNNFGISSLLAMGITDVFISNSDLYFQSPLTLSQLLKAKESKVGIICPIIKNLDGSIEQRVSYKRKLFLIRVIKNFIFWLLNINLSVENIVGKSDFNFVKQLTGLQNDRYIISGSGFLLTSNFFEYYSGLYPGTFLYYEEEASMCLLHKSSLLTKVAETDFIIHKGGASTPSEVKSLSKVRRKICTQSIFATLRLVFTPSFLAKKWY